VTAAGRASRAGRVSGALAFDIGQLDPFEAASAGSLAVLGHVHESLMHRDLADGELRCGLLAAPPRKVGHQAFELVLCRGLRFGDGSSLGAADVAASLRRYLALARRSENVVATHLGAIGSVETASPPGTLVISTLLPGAALAQRLSMVRVVPRAHAEDGSGRVGAGPYQLAVDERPHRVLLRASAAYRGPRAARCEEVELVAELDAGRRVAALRRGRCHVIEDSPPGFTAVGDLRAASVQSNNMAWLAFNCSAPPFDRTGIRRAVGYALDRAEIAERCLGGNLWPADSLLAAWHPDHHPTPETPAHDERKARAALAAAGLAGFRCRLFVSSVSWARAQAGVVAEQLARAGLEVVITIGNTSEFFARDAPAGDFELALCTGDPSVYGTSGAFLLGWYLAGSWPRRYLHWDGPVQAECERLLREAENSGEAGPRGARLARVQRLAGQHVPILPLGHRCQPTAWAARLRHFRPQLTTGLDLAGTGLAADDPGPSPVAWIPGRRDANTRSLKGEH
jgi:peptide/nickel transport system substrate-binding protein